MIDDCQVQKLTCYWSGGHTYPEEERINIELRVDPEAYQRKAGLLFLDVGRGLYFPLHDDLSPETILLLAEQLVERFRSTRELVAQGFHREAAHQMLPIQRVFHRSKLGLFRTTTIEEMRLRFG